MEPWRSPGDVLRWWRMDVLGWTQQQAAERLTVRPSALSNWERDDRDISVDLDTLDAALDGGRLLAGLLWATGTPDGLEPGRLWSWVFPGEPRPVWMWIRSPAPQIRIEAEWGVARLEADFDLGPNGVFITLATSLPDSPVVVQLSAPAWVDFGSGARPDEVPGAEVVDAIDLLQPSSAQGPLMDMFATTLEARVASHAPGASDLAERVPDAIDGYLNRDPSDRCSDGNGGPQRWRPVPEGLDALERRRYGQLRRARKMALATLAARVRAETGLHASRDTVRRFEHNRGTPNDRQLPAALDHALGAGGRLAVLDLRSGKGEGSMPFPGFWRGPFWIAFDGPPDRWPVSATLRRGKFQRELHLDGPALVSAHWFDPAVPLRLTVDPEIRWEFGIGRRAGAEAIDQGWAPINLDVANQAVSDIEGAMYDAAKKPRPDQSGGSPGREGEGAGERPAVRGGGDVGRGVAESPGQDGPEW